MSAQNATTMPPNTLSDIYRRMAGDNADGLARAQETLRTVRKPHIVDVHTPLYTNDVVDTRGGAAERDDNKKIGELHVVRDKYNGACVLYMRDTGDMVPVFGLSKGDTYKGATVQAFMNTRVHTTAITSPYSLIAKEALSGYPIHFPAKPPRAAFTTEELLRRAHVPALPELVAMLQAPALRTARAYWVKGNSRITHFGDLKNTDGAPLVDWQLVVLATSTEALLLEHDYPTPRLWRVRVNDVFPTESGEGGRVVDIQSEELVLETKNGRTNLAFWKMCSRTSGRLRNRGGMDALQIHPATAATAKAAAAPAPAAAAAASASNKRKHEDEGTLIEEVD